VKGLSGARGLNGSGASLGNGAGGGKDKIRVLILGETTLPAVHWWRLP
jgi:hypothetical protein